MDLKACIALMKEHQVAKAKDGAAIVPPSELHRTQGQIIDIGGAGSTAVPPAAPEGAAPSTQGMAARVAASAVEAEAVALRACGIAARADAGGGANAGGGDIGGVGSAAADGAEGEGEEWLGSLLREVLAAQEGRAAVYAEMREGFRAMKAARLFTGLPALTTGCTGRFVALSNTVNAVERVLRRASASASASPGVGSVGGVGGVGGGVAAEAAGGGEGVASVPGPGGSEAVALAQELRVLQGFEKEKLMLTAAQQLNAMQLQIAEQAVEQLGEGGGEGAGRKAQLLEADGARMLEEEARIGARLNEITTRLRRRAAQGAALAVDGDAADGADY